MTASLRSLRRCSAATTACRLPSPPATTIVREPARCSTPSSSPGFDVAVTSTDAWSKSDASARSRVSSSAVPAPRLVITSSGSTRRTLAERPAASGPALVAWRRKSPGGCCRGCLYFLVSTGSPTLVLDRRREGGGDARDRDPRCPVGRRGQGQGDRPARHHRHHRLRRPHQRRPQRRPHHRRQRREVRDPPAAQRHPHPGRDLGDRQRRGRLARGAVPRARRAARARRRAWPTWWSAPTRT